MNLSRVVVSCLTLAWLTTAASADSHPDILSRESCTVSDGGNYAQYLERQLTTWREESAAAAKQGMTMRDEAAVRAGLLTPTEYAERHRRGRVDCERLTYRSDGLKVIGFVWRSPKRAKSQQPLLVFNRGGAQEFSKLRPNTQFGFYRFVQAGYVVVGSQYRGNDGGEGRDELGAADVGDVLKLIEIAKTFDNVDPVNMFALGYSRGGMQTLLAAKRGAEFRAAATVGLPADLLSSYRRDPRSANSLRALIPDFESNSEAALRARSAVYWPEEIQLPLLLIAGSADPSVATHTGSVALAARLGDLQKGYELVVYEGDSHGVMINARDRDERILRWFSRYRKPSSSVPSR